MGDTLCCWLWERILKLRDGRMDGRQRINEWLMCYFLRPRETESWHDSPFIQVATNQAQ